MRGQDVETLVLSPGTMSPTRQKLLEMAIVTLKRGELHTVSQLVALPFLSLIRYYLLLLGCVPINPLGYIPYNMTHGISFVS
jgi:hypothetical protein